MFAQQSAYILGVVNLLLAGIAVFCVVQAEDYPEHFSLVYITVSIFIFYMTTILVIIILQIIETCQEQYTKNHSSLEVETPTLTTEVLPQLNSIMDETIRTPIQQEKRLSRSQTLPLFLSSNNYHNTSSLNLKKFKYTSKDLTTTSPCPALLPKYQQTLVPIHKNYQSFAFITNDHR